MKGLAPLIGIIFIIALVIKYWWIVLIAAILIGVGYLIVNRTAPPKTATKVPANKPRSPEPQPGVRITVSGPQTTRPVSDPAPRRAAVPVSPLRNALLTRQPTPNPASNNTFTAIDLETTGLDADIDRIVEVGLVKFTGDGTVLDEFSTLVEARDVHRIDDEDLVGAPDISQVLPEVLAFISGTVLVAHNLEFEERFLAAAARRARIPLSDGVALCTLRTCRRQLDGRALSLTAMYKFSLTAMYKTATGEWAENRHTALGDARAIRDVLLWLLRQCPSPLYLTEPPPKAVGALNFDTCPISCRPVALTRASVAELLASLPQSPTPRKGNPAAIARYRSLLDNSVEDGRLTFEEATSLTKQARLTQLTGAQLRTLHEDAWATAFHEDAESEWSDLTPVRRREMYLLADALGLDELAAKIQAAIDSCAEPAPPPESRYLRGTRIGIVGNTAELAKLRTRAETYGAKVAVRITNTVAWLATVTPDAVDARHKAAREIGIPILDPAAATKRLNEDIRDAELKAFERQRIIDEHAERRRQRLAEADAYWRPSWRALELDHDPKPDFDY
jgi:DNA polymerase III epsilon subunit-like protein